MRAIQTQSLLLAGVRRFSDAQGRFAQIETIDYQSGVVVYSVLVDDAVQHGFRTTIKEIMAGWKVMDPGEKHPWQVAADKKKQERAENRDII